MDDPWGNAWSSTNDPLPNVSLPTPTLPKAPSTTAHDDPWGNSSTDDSAIQPVGFDLSVQPQSPSSPSPAAVDTGFSSSWLHDTNLGPSWSTSSSVVDAQPASTSTWNADDSGWGASMDEYEVPTLHKPIEEEEPQHKVVEDVPPEDIGLPMSPEVTTPTFQSINISPTPLSVPSSPPPTLPTAPESPQDHFGSFESAFPPTTPTIATATTTTHDESPDGWGTTALPTATEDADWGSAWTHAESRKAPPPREKDEWEIAQEVYRRREAKIPSQVINKLIDEWKELAVGIWPHAFDPPDESDNWRGGLDKVPGLERLVDSVFPEVVLPPPFHYSKTSIAKSQHRSIGLTRNFAMTRTSPLSHLLASKGSTSWERAAFREKKESIDLNWIPKPTPVEIPKDPSAGKEVKAGGGGLLSFFGKKSTTTAPTTATSTSASPSTPTAPSPPLVESRSSSPKHTRGTSENSVRSIPENPPPSIVSQPPKPTTETTPTSAVSPVPLDIFQVEQPPSAVSRFLSRFSRTKSTQKTSVPLSSSDLNYLSDLVPSANDDDDEEDQLEALERMLSSTATKPTLLSKATPTPLPPPLAPPPAPPPTTRRTIFQLEPQKPEEVDWDVFSSAPVTPTISLPASQSSSRPPTPSRLPTLPPPPSLQVMVGARPHTPQLPQTVTPSLATPTTAVPTTPTPPSPPPKFADVMFTSNGHNHSRSSSEWGYQYGSPASTASTPAAPQQAGTSLFNNSSQMQAQDEDDSFGDFGDFMSSSSSPSVVAAPLAAASPPPPRLPSKSPMTNNTRPLRQAGTGSSVNATRPVSAIMSTQSSLSRTNTPSPTLPTIAAPPPRPASRSSMFVKPTPTSSPPISRTSSGLNFDFLSQTSSPLSSSPLSTTNKLPLNASTSHAPRHTNSLPPPPLPSKAQTQSQATALLDFTDDSFGAMATRPDPSSAKSPLSPNGNQTAITSPLSPSSLSSSTSNPPLSWGSATITSFTPKPASMSASKNTGLSAQDLSFFEGL